MACDQDKNKFLKLNFEIKGSWLQHLCIFVYAAPAKSFYVRRIAAQTNN